MSVDAHELERAALQKKDREQLQAIARAMGGRPSSRARKDQIIDMIMGLAGGPVPSPPLFGGVGAEADAPAAVEAAGATSPSVHDTGGPDHGDGGRPPAAEQGVAGNGRGGEEHPTGEAGGDVRALGSATPATPSGLAPVEGTVGSDTDAVAAADIGGEDHRPETAAGERPGGAENGQRPVSPTARFVFSPDDPGPGAGSDPDDDIRPGRGPGFDLRPARPAFGGHDPARGGVGSNGPGRRTDVVADEADADADAEADAESDAETDGGSISRGAEFDAQGEGVGRRRRRRGKDRNRDDRVERNDRTDRSDRLERDERRDLGPRPAADDASLQEAVAVSGFLDLREEGYGFLRVRGLLPSKEDVYVPSKFVRQFSLRKGDRVQGSSRPAGRGEKNPALLRIDAVNGHDPERARSRARFEDLTPLFPDEKLRLERADDPSNMTARIIDLIAPIGKGQRGLIVSPPKAGKTTIMKQIAQSIEANNPEVRLIVLLVDERPEEVTDMRRSVQGEVVASTFDRPADEHTAVAELTIERAKRMVELGEDVVIILDGITRLARAYNLAAPATGRIMSGGIDTGALYPPKKFFGAARNVEEGGSLTILATALVETGSRMDEVIFEEFKGTGNMELRLDRRMAEKRIYPAIDVDASSTRHEELLFERRQLQMVWKLRRVLSGLAESNAGLELLVDRMKTFRSNDEFLAEVAKAPAM